MATAEAERPSVIGQHISRKYDEALEDVRTSVLAMGGLVEEQITNALTALAELDSELGERVIRDDYKVNQLEVQIDEECTRVIALHQPAASDLRLVVAIIKTITDLERMGDEAEKIGRTAIRLSGNAPRRMRYAGVRNLGRHVRQMVRQALDAFARLDVEAAVAVAREIGAAQVVVTGTAADRERLALARALGADAAIDVEEEDPVARVRDLTGGEGADVVVDVSAGATEPLLQAVEMVRKGGTVVVAGLKTGNALDGFHTDRLIYKEVSMLGALSSDWADTAEAIAILKARWRELAALCTHAYPIGDAETAVRVLGREARDGPEPIHVHIDASAR